MLNWKIIHPQATPAMLGFIPGFLFETDPRPAREQINERYAHGGGWRPFKGHHKLDMERLVLTYPGDPPMRALAETKLRDERIVFFDCAWLAIIQRDGAYEISQID